MIITRTLHILDAVNGDFVGAAEFHDDVVDLWSEDGDVDTHMFVNGLQGDDLYREIVGYFAAEMGTDGDYYLTDDDESVIVYY